MASRQDGSSRRSGGRNVGQFTIDKEIGKGSFAQVYMGWHKVRYFFPAAFHQRRVLASIIVGGALFASIQSLLPPLAPLDLALLSSLTFLSLSLPLRPLT